MEIIGERPDLGDATAAVYLRALLDVLGELRAAGTGCAIDDFGAGYSSLARLLELEFDAIKIDRGLLAGVPREATGTAILQALIGLARACKVEIVAQGVESEEQIEFLSENGIDRAQGFLFGHPVSGEEIVPLLSRHLLTDSAAA